MKTQNTAVLGKALLIAVMCVAAAACSKKVKEVPPTDTGPSTGGVTDPGPTTPGAFGPDDLDQDALRPEFQAIMGCHAKYLRDRPSSRLTLEGNTDERGSREYNMGLGERRGNAASSAVQASGGSAAQMTVVSFGEERPVCTDSNEECWARNRRAELVYTAK